MNFVKGNQNKDLIYLIERVSSPKFTRYSLKNTFIIN